MAPKGLAILIGAGPNTGAGIARILASPSHGNLAVALLARRPEPLHQLTASLRASTPGSTIEAFPADTTPASLERAFSAIASHAALANLPLELAIYSVKHSSKKPFLEETHADFTDSLTTYVGGAFAFAQLAVRRFLRDHGEQPLGAPGSPPNAKKGTLVFTGTLGALRCSAQFAAYGAGRAGVRQLAQSLARELSPLGIHVVHTIANGGIRDEMGEGREDGEEEKKAVAEGKRMSAESVGRAYLWLHEQGVDLWTHELDLRPAQEKF
ncbi:NAD(P)-binding protein [Viridothelium virens]|uniref:NAD(P)-binding protein n=1 Tax=Viridothelium virens TaxID=1048519 RepID=A0A6A6H5C4_VIRVR|nr:NAD(P)-binding protein [Viridothelium virens]